MSRPRVSAARWSSTGSPSGSAAAASDEQPGVGRELEEALGVALLDLAGHRLAAGKPEPAGELGGWFQVRGSSSRASGLPWLSATICSHTAASSGPCTWSSSSARASLSPSPWRTSSGSPARTSSPTARARRAHDRDPLGEETAGDEPEDLGRGVVEPLRVVDDADERLLLGDLGEQRQRGQADQEPVGRRRRAQPEHRRERIALRIGQAVEVDPASARRADGARCRPAPSPTRRRPPWRRASPRPGRTRSPAGRSCPRPPHPAGR